MLSKARKWASISIGASLLGNMDGRFFLRAFLLEEFLLWRVFLSIGALLANLEGVHLRGLLREKK